MPVRRVSDCVKLQALVYDILPSARFGYATEGALFISGQLSTDAVSALRKVGVLTRLENIAPKHACKHEAQPPRVEKEFRLNSNDSGFI